MQVAESAPGGPAPSRLALTIGLVLTVSMAAFESLAVATILPGTLREIGGLPYYGWIFTAFMLANVIGIPLAGREADRRGPLVPFLIGIFLFTAGLAAAGIARSMPLLVCGRVLQGAGAAAISAVAYVAVARAYPQSEQPRVMALLSTAWVVPGLFGPALAAGIAKAFGWRAVFLGLAPLSGISGVLAISGLRNLPAPPQPASADGDGEGGTPVRNATQLALGVALALLGLSSPHLLGTIAAELAGAALALHAVRRLLPLDVLRARRGLAAALWVIALINLAFSGVEAFLPLALTEVRRAGSSLVAASLTAGTLSWTAGAWLQTRLTETVPRARLLRFGLCALFVGLFALTCVLLPQVPPSSSVVGWGIAGFGMGIAFQVSTLAIIEAAPSGREGGITATMQIGNSLAVAIGTGIGGDLVNRLSQPGQPAAGGIALADGAALLSCVVALILAGGVRDSAESGANV